MESLTTLASENKSSISIRLLDFVERGQSTSNYLKDLLLNNFCIPTFIPKLCCIPFFPNALNSSCQQKLFLVLARDLPFKLIPIQSIKLLLLVPSYSTFGFEINPNTISNRAIKKQMAVVFNVSFLSSIVFSFRFSILLNILALAYLEPAAQDLDQYLWSKYIPTRYLHSQAQLFCVSLFSSSANFQIVSLL